MTNGSILQAVMKNYRVWAALEDGKPVGVVMVEVEEDLTGNIALFSRSVFARRGIWKSAHQKDDGIAGNEPDQQMVRRN
ncbi:hypothetical protein AAG663_02295 [Bacillus licheniformis]